MVPLVILNLGPFKIPLFGGFGGRGGRFLPDCPPAFVVVVLKEVNDVSDESLCVKPSGVLIVQLEPVPPPTVFPVPPVVFCEFSNKSRSK